MGRQRWALLLLLFVGVGLGVAIAGVPDRSEDPPLRVRAVAPTTTSSSTTVAPPPPDTAPLVEETTTTVKGRPRRAVAPSAVTASVPAEVSPASTPDGHTDPAAAP